MDIIARPLLEAVAQTLVGVLGGLLTGLKTRYLSLTLLMEPLIYGKEGFIAKTLALGMP